jgi:hypothetical protein
MSGERPGKPSELPSALADAFVSAVREQEARQADTQVADAIALGWYLAALAHPGQVTETAAATRGRAAGLAALTEGQMVDFCLSHVRVAFARLRDLVDQAGLALPDADLEELGQRVDSEQEEARRKAVVKVDSKTLAALSAADFRLGKAYGVGAALMNLTTRPLPSATLREHLTEAGIAPVLAAIDDLSSALPPHAGHSVRESVREWQKSVETGSRVVPEAPETWLQLARQGELWRAVLSGEKRGLDLLEIEDYVDAADRLADRMGTMALRVVRRFRLAFGLVALVFVAGVVLLLLTDSAAAIVAGAGAVLASLGFTWRGAGRSLGGLAAKLERPLWGAELDTAITQAITLLERESERDVTGERRKVAVALGIGVTGSRRP